MAAKKKKKTRADNGQDQLGKRRGKHGKYSPGEDEGQSYDLWENPEGQRKQRDELEESIYSRSNIKDDLSRRRQSRALAQMLVHVDLLSELETIGKISAEESKSITGCITRVGKLFEAHGLDTLEDDDGPAF